jgi:hypothetical protein
VFDNDFGCLNVLAVSMTQKQVSRPIYTSMYEEVN